MKPTIRITLVVLKERAPVRNEHSQSLVSSSGHVGVMRRRQGFSVATVLCIGVIAGMWMLGTAALVIPAVSRVTKERVHDLARSSAEAGLDWVITQLNDPAKRTAVDGATLDIPNNVMALNTLIGTVKVESFPAPSSSYLYDQTCDWGLSSWNTSAATTCNNVYGGNGWRSVTANVIAGRNSRTVRVILKPIYTATTQNIWVTGEPVPFFSFALASGQGVEGTGNLVTNSYTSSMAVPLPFVGFNNTGGDIVTNGTALLAGTTTIGGNLSAYASNNGAALIGPKATILQNVVTNGTAQGTLINIKGTYSPYAEAPNANFPPVPTAPASATRTSINLSGSENMTLASGDYIVQSISISGNAQLHIDSSGGPVNVYVNGAGSSAGITIGGNGVSNLSRPTAFRIWYPGSGIVQIGGNGLFSGTLYAPNAPVKFNGNGAIYGGVVGSTLQIIGNPQLHYDNALQTEGPMYFPVKVLNKPAAMLDYYQAVSWYEF